jgi:large subunit ribosomal protein L24
MKTKLRKNDQVVVISGREKGKQGKVLQIDRVKGRIMIEGVNLVKKAMRKTQKRPQGGIAEVEAGIAISNVMAVDRKGQRTRLGYKVDGDAKTRVSRKTKEEIG